MMKIEGECWLNAMLVTLYKPKLINSTSAESKDEHDLNETSLKYQNNCIQRMPFQALTECKRDREIPPGTHQTDTKYSDLLEVSATTSDQFSVCG